MKSKTHSGEEIKLPTHNVNQHTIPDLNENYVIFKGKYSSHLGTLLSKAANLGW